MRGLGEDRNVRPDSVVVIDVMIPDFDAGSRHFLSGAKFIFGEILVIFSATISIRPFHLLQETSPASFMLDLNQDSGLIVYQHWM
jgi:hypothetical protein